MTKIKYKRVLLKLSGELLGSTTKFGLDKSQIELFAGEISTLQSRGIQTAVVIGGGNFFRGAQASEFGMERSAADYMGMLATCINGLALQAVLENRYKIHTRVMTSIHMPELAEHYIRRKAVKHLTKNRVVIFAGGTGNPLFTTDTAAALRAREVGCEVILKATKVDGIYDLDPKKHKNAKRFDKLDYLQVISKKLQVMDATAITMCMESSLPILVFKADYPESVIGALENPKLGTIVS
ncbi:MAG: UMP kinase [Zetaproteobacteria bacterium]|nr:UMP kinase [Pseudobdellovibrionaceae bacterium]